MLCFTKAESAYRFWRYKEVEAFRVTPIQPDNSGAQKQLQQWLKEVDVAELDEEEQGPSANCWLNCKTSLQLRSALG